MRASLIHLAGRRILCPDNEVRSQHFSRCDGCSQIFAPGRLLRWTVNYEPAPPDRRRWFCSDCNSTLLKEIPE